MRILNVFKGAAGVISLAAFCVSAAQAEPLDPYEMLPGYWGWIRSETETETFGTCADSPLQIWFSEDRRYYYSQHMGSDQQVTAPILFNLPSSEEAAGFLLQYEGEERLDDDGNPVSWYLLMTAPDRFVWVRNDWVAHGGSTAPLEKCEGIEVS